MRIQHNIMAMNAYRNYNNNTSALSKNLERLSSGYKINRAGDDAAGLAISEKMRAQITGLEAAQKNVKDGISLVNTAEGAMQEIQDMLNRMVYLAQQSANGTYDDEVDRANLQKEVASLKSEINRIADSANFNGTKLLDGSLDKNGVKSITSSFDLPNTGAVLGTDTVLHVSDQVVNAKTKFSIDLHNFEFENKAGKDLEIKFGEYAIKVAGGTVKEGSNAVYESDSQTATALATMTYGGVTVDVTKEDLADQLTDFANAYTSDDYTVVADTTTGAEKLTFTSKKGYDSATPTGPDGTALQQAPSQAKIVATSAKTALTGGGNQDYTLFGFTASVDTTAATTDKAQADLWVAAFNASDNGQEWQASAAVDGTITLTAVKYGSTTSTGATDISGADGTLTEGDDATFDTNTTLTATPLATMEIGGYEVDVTKTNLDDQLADFVAAYNADANNTDFEAAVSTDDPTKIVFTSKLQGADAAAATAPTGTTQVSEKMTAEEVVKAITEGKASFVDKDGTETALDPTGVKVTIDGVDFELKAEGNRLNFIQMDEEQLTTDGGTVDGRMDVMLKIGDKELVRGDYGDYNASTTNIVNKGENNADRRIASTYFDLTADMVAEGASIKIGNHQFEFVTEKGAKVKTNGNIAVDISDLDPKSSNYLSDVAERLTDVQGTTLKAAAKEDQVWTVGHDGNRITVTEYVAHDEDLTDQFGNVVGKQSYTDRNSTPDADNKPVLDKGAFDLTTEEGIKKSLGFTTAAKEGGSLSLQIGDSSDSFNQLKVSIGDMHVAAMGVEGGMSIADIDISTQKGAQEAVDVIKSAINYVSSVRGDLGAISNRLDHTANNLSVMRENIQDAESTIRDTDIAEEMMAYTKNNILVQSAQAMLAQANQVPQGVLQLLQ